MKEKLLSHGFITIITGDKVVLTVIRTEEQLWEYVRKGYKPYLMKSVNRWYLRRGSERHIIDRRLKCWRDEGVWDRILRASASIRGHGMVAVDSSTVEAKRGRACRIQCFKHRRGTKIHVCINRDSMP